MKRIVIPEHGKIPRDSLGPRLVHRLQAADEGLAASTGKTIFDWSRRSVIVAKNYVGVLQVRGLVVEILPKVDLAQDGAFAGDDDRQLAQSNLLYMLSFTRKLPIRERDLANLKAYRQPLLEALIRLFATRLLAELQRGLEHSYLRREENLGFVKGKILVTEQLRHNLAQKQRIFVAYDEFLPDIWLNRILKAASRQLLRVTQVAWTERCLREAMLYLEGVRDVQVRAPDFDRVQLNRNSQRFSALFDFARLVLCDAAPAPQHGETQTFSLLFPMEAVFEEFIGEMIRRYSERLELIRAQVHLQARGRRKWLLRSETGSGRFRLKPDILIGTANESRIIIDTKWKRLLPDALDARNGVRQGDLYQLYAYAQRYECPDNVLLFPALPGVTGKCYSIDEDPSGKRVRVEVVGMNRDLHRDRDLLLEELKRAIQPRPNGQGNEPAVRALA